MLSQMKVKEANFNVISSYSGSDSTTVKSIILGFELDPNLDRKSKLSTGM